MKYLIPLFFGAALFFISCKSEKRKTYDNILKLRKEYHAHPDIENAKLLDSAYKLFAGINPRDTSTPKFLYEDALLHEGHLNNPVQAAAILKQIFTDYPDHELAPKALFHYAFLHETKLGNEGEARRAYNMFLVKYPKHDLADDAKASLDNLGKDLNELIKGFEQKDSTNVQ
jgi:hypothetical protein